MENTISLRVNVTHFETMLASKMIGLTKSEAKELANHIFKTLQDSNRIEMLGQILMNAIPEPKIEIGDRVFVPHEDTKREAKFIGFNPYAEYRQYEIMFTDDGTIEWMSEWSFSTQEEQKVEVTNG